MNSPVLRLTKKDAEICRAMRSVILQGEFKIQGAAARQVGLLFTWLSDLDIRIEETLKPQALPAAPAPVDAPIDAPIGSRKGKK